MEPIASLDVLTLDARDPRALAEFYGAVLGFEIDESSSDETWVQLSSTTGMTLAFQHSPNHRAPEWPSETDHLQAHFDFYVDDFDVAEPLLLDCGARKADHQPWPDSFRVYLDPAGHPFCLCRRRG